MQQQRYPIFERIGKMLHDQLEDIAREPLPEHWNDLINYLNDQERGQDEDSPPARSCPSKLKPLKS
jgi:hypothetical protein